MAKAFLPQAEKYTKRHGRRKRWQKIVSAMACVVVFCTAYALILPAITMEQTAYCGITAHTHDADCYQDRLICDESEEPQATEPAHQHGADCYEEQETLICGQKESEEHSHTQACYQKKRVLTCTLPTEETQSKQAHTHTDACYEKKLVCDQEEHKHSLACYSNPEADVERKTVWERTMKDVKLTDVWEDDVIAIAESQIGYTESEKNYIVQADGKTTQGYTRYGAWYGDPYGDWCAMFVSFCLHYADIPKSAVPYEASCAKWVKALSKKTWDLYHSAKEYTPQKGDLIFLDTDGDKTADHVGLVAQVDETEKTLQVIEGNSKDKVRSVTYHQKDSQILGYGALPAQEDCDPADEEEPTTEAQPTEPDTSEPEPDTSEPEPDASEPDTSEPNQGGDEDGNKPAVPQAPLTEDSAYVSSLSLQDVAVLSDADTSAYQEQTVRNQDALSYPFTAKLAAYGEEDTFDSARLKVEAVLLLDEEKATFDLDAMPWLEQDKAHAPKVKTENREIDGETVSCQVLTGYTLSQSTDGDNVVPGRVAQSVVVALTDAQPGDTVSLQLSAATEYSTWEDTCATHNLVEKRTVTAEPYTVVAALTEEELEANYQRFLEEVEQLEATEDWDATASAAATDLLTRLEEAYGLGQLTEEAYTELTQRVQALLDQENQAVAEAAHGDNWKKLRDSGWFEEYSATSTKDVLSRKAVRAALEGDKSPSAVQIDEPGGPATEDDVTVSKTIQGTDLENVFDITLKVETPQKIQEVVTEPDMAVVIVMDISNTMKDNFGGVTRYAAAMEAADDFLDKFVANNTLGVSKVGYVAFNTDAHQIFGLQSCTNETQASALKNTMRTSTGSIINTEGYGSAHNRFTNIEGGLKMAQDMLSGVSNKNKFIILLTDGFPTTYLESGYKGYDPYDTTGRFYDHVLNVPCSSGTSYSDEAAIRAKNEAAKIREAGTTIFSIGVDVGGQTIQAYIESSEKLAKGEAKISVVDRTGTTYEIGDASSTESYKNWLKNSIGSGYYYDSTNAEGLKNAYTQIFEQIKTTVAKNTEADWVATDPIPSDVEFIGLYDKNDGLKVSLTGTNTVDGENTANYGKNEDEDTKDTNEYVISWDLKDSGYTETKVDSTTTYTYTIKYRVRLMNETGDFVENQVYDTNGTTKLQYRIVQTVNDTTTISDSKTIDFPIPSVHGFLGELTFTKEDNYGRPVEGAVFTLSHDTDTCKICRGDNTAVTTVNPQTATSDADGKVSFTDIPSGHTYTLVETKIPDGYQKTGEHYRVIVAYDKVTVQVEKGGKWSAAEDWKGTITNYTGYQLPATGGAGTTLYTAGGLLLMTAAGLFLLYRYRTRSREA